MFYFIFYINFCCKVDFNKLTPRVLHILTIVWLANDFNSIGCVWGNESKNTALYYSDNIKGNGESLN